MASNTARQYIATVRNVKEVILSGTADLDYWRDLLKRENLIPYNSKGQAELQISATRLSWMGMHSREFSVSVRVDDRANAGQPAGFYLAGAFNSSRLLAFTERTFFKTPYQHASIEVEHRAPACVELNTAHGVILVARMAGSAPRLRSRDELWEGAIFLPMRVTRMHDAGQLFYASLGGFTDTYPFSPATDTLTLTPSPNDQVIRWLVESNFTAGEWRLRDAAMHARSKTCPR